MYTELSDFQKRQAAYLAENGEGRIQSHAQILCAVTLNDFRTAAYMGEDQTQFTINGPSFPCTRWRVMGTNIYVFDDGRVI